MFLGDILLEANSRSIWRHDNIEIFIKYLALDITKVGRDDGIYEGTSSNWT